MDARLVPAKYACLSEGDAHVIRNAGAISYTHLRAQETKANLVGRLLLEKKKIKKQTNKKKTKHKKKQDTQQ